MRIGISTFARTWEVGVPGFPVPHRPLDHRKMVSDAHEGGMPIVQFGDNLPLGEVGDLAELLRHADELGVAIEVGTRGCHVDNLRRYLAIAQHLRSPFVRVVIDAGEDEPDIDEVARRFGEVRNDFVQAGVVLAVENHDRFRVDELVDLVRRSGDWVGICLDTVNSFGALEGPDVVIDALAPFTVNVHLKDFDVVRAGHSMGFSVVGRPLGEGRLDVRELLAHVSRVGRAESAVIELWTPFDGDIATTVRTEQDWVKRSIRYAHQLGAAHR